MAWDIRKEYRSIPPTSYTISQIDEIFPHGGSEFNQHVLALAHAGKMTAGYMDEQLKYITMGFNDTRITTQTLRKHLGNKEMQITNKNVCVTAINSYKNIQLLTGADSSNSEVFYYVTKLRCAYMSFLVTKWGAVEDLEKAIPDFRSQFRQELKFLEEHDPQKPSQVTTSQALPSQPSQQSMLSSQQNIVQRSDSRSDDYLKASMEDFKYDLSHIKISDWDGIMGQDELKETLEDSVRIRLGITFYKGEGWDMPAGVLLHGPTGTGKTSIVASFARKWDLQMWQLDSTALGSLQGDRFKIIKILFQELEQAAIKRPVVLLLDQADDLLQTQPPHESHRNSVQTFFKHIWSEMMIKRVQIYVFGTTNKPWNLSMSDWVRRFEIVSCIELPNAHSRKQLISCMLQCYYNNLSSYEREEVVEASTGHTASDIRRVFSALKEQLAGLSYYKAQSFVSETVNGEQILRPLASRSGAIQKCYGDLTEDQKAKAGSPIDADMLKKLFRSLKKRTVNPNEEKKHVLWERDVLWK